MSNTRSVCLAFIGAVALALGNLQSSAQDACCPVTHGYLKKMDFPDPCRADLFSAPAKGNAGVILAREFLTAGYNLFDQGCRPDVEWQAIVEDAYDAALGLLTEYYPGGPCDVFELDPVRTNTEAGKLMLEQAEILGAYNEGMFNAGCYDEL